MYLPVIVRVVSPQPVIQLMPNHAMSKPVIAPKATVPKTSVKRMRTAT